MRLAIYDTSGLGATFPARPARAYRRPLPRAPFAHSETPVPNRTVAQPCDSTSYRRPEPSTLWDMDARQYRRGANGNGTTWPVRYKISEAPIAAGLCHRDRRRPQSGSAFLTVVIRRSTIEIEEETAVFDDIVSRGFHRVRARSLL